MDISEQLEQLLKEHAASLGKRLSLAGIKEYSLARMRHLAGIRSRGEPGFDIAMAQEIKNVAMMAAINITADADAMDAELLALLKGALTIGVTALKNV